MRMLWHFQVLCVWHPQQAHYLQADLCFRLQYTVQRATLTIKFLFPAWKADSFPCARRKDMLMFTQTLTPDRVNEYFSITCKLKIQWLPPLTYIMHRSMLGRDWLQPSVSLCGNKPSHPPSNSLFLMLWWFSASQGLFCSIQRGNHGNGSLTLGVLLQLLQAWPEFLTAS